MVIGKRVNMFLPYIFTIIVICVIIIIIRNQNWSPISSTVHWVSESLEGFGVAPTTALQCPANYRFFNDAAGGSFCCRGKVNPFTHTCEAAQGGRTNMCAFRPNVPDPRGPGLPTLPLCNAVADTIRETNQKGFCPSRLPNYVSSGKCCAGPTQLDGEECSATDLADTSRYCVIGARVNKPGEQLCKNMRLVETGNCPSGMQRISYTLGAREKAKYGNNAAGVTMPVCFNMENACMPDEAIQEVQKSGIFNDKNNLPRWKYACSGYNTQFVQRDLTGTFDNKYI